MSPWCFFGGIERHQHWVDSDAHLHTRLNSSTNPRKGCVAPSSFIVRSLWPGVKIMVVEAQDPFSITNAIVRPRIPRWSWQYSLLYPPPDGVIFEKGTDPNKRFTGSGLRPAWSSPKKDNGTNRWRQNVRNIGYLQDWSPSVSSHVRREKIQIVENFLFPLEALARVDIAVPRG